MIHQMQRLERIREKLGIAYLESRACILVHRPRSENIVCLTVQPLAILHTDYVLHEVRQTGVLLEAVGVKTNISLTVTHTTLGTYHVCHLLINVGADLMTFVCDKRL